MGEVAVSQLFILLLVSAPLFNMVVPQLDTILMAQLPNHLFHVSQEFSMAGNILWKKLLLAILLLSKHGELIRLVIFSSVKLLAISMSQCVLPEKSLLLKSKSLLMKFHLTRFTFQEFTFNEFVYRITLKSELRSVQSLLKVMSNQNHNQLVKK